MSGIEELVIAAAEAYEAAKLLKEGVAEAWDKFSEAYSYISSYFINSSKLGKYNSETVAARVWAMCWVAPLDVLKFINQLTSRNVAENVDRTIIYSSMHSIQVRPAWSFGARYPDSVCLPLLGLEYRTAFMGMYTNLNSISLCIKYNNSKNLESYIDNYNNYMNNFVSVYSAGSLFFDRDKLELKYGLKWLRD